MANRIQLIDGTLILPEHWAAIRSTKPIWESVCRHVVHECKVDPCYGTDEYPVALHNICTTDQAYASLVLALATYDPKVKVVPVESGGPKTRGGPTKQELTEAAECGFTLRETCELLDLTPGQLQHYRSVLVPGLKWVDSRRFSWVDP